MEEEDSVTLPSWDIYAELENGRRGQCTFPRGHQERSSLEQSMIGSLHSYTKENWDWIDKIVQNYCYVCNGREQWMRNLSDEQRYSFFYYWLGDKIKDKYQTGSTFSMVMTAIYEKLEKFDPTCNCKNLYEGILKDRFKKAKILFDWFYNYSKLHDQAMCSEYCNNNEKCNAPFQKALLTYNDVSDTCSRTDGDKYCPKFKEPSKKEEYKEPKKLECRQPPQPARSPSPEETDTNKLPSRKIYAALDQGVGKSCTLNGSKRNNTTLEKQLEGSLSPYKGENWTWIKEIPGNYCLTCKGTGREEFATLSSSDRYSFFYYWLGDKINKGKPKGGASISMVMGAICNALKDSMYKCKCTNIYNGISKDKFEQAKKVFDWYYNHNKIQSSEECHNYLSKNGTCSTAYDEASKAYSDLTSNCGTTEGEAYCDKYKKNRQKKEYQEPKELTCPEQLARMERAGEEDRVGDVHATSEGPQEGAGIIPGKSGSGSQVPTETKKLEEDDELKAGKEAGIGVPGGISGAGTPAASASASFSGVQLQSQESVHAEVESTASTSPGSTFPTTAISSGAAAAVAVPLIASLLYKYTSLFSGIRNSFFGGGSSSNSRGGGRKKREGSSLRREINEFESDNSSTEYSTVGSTTGSITDPSVYSVPYIR